MTIIAPFPYFGGKSAIADLVWERLGDVDIYCEPFFGSGATLLARPDSHNWADRTENANDIDCMVANFWRATSQNPDAVAAHADWPVNENDLHARHAWLVSAKQNLRGKMEGDPEYYDAKIAGWWVWCMCAWIGGEFCSGKGPWSVVKGELVRGEDGAGIAKRRRPHLGDDGRGINRQRPHLGDDGKGINRQRPHLGDDGKGHCELWSEHLRGIFAALRNRLRRVRVCCGEWDRILTPCIAVGRGTTGVFLDPPYADTAGRDPSIYTHDCGQVAHAVREWAIANGDDKRWRIALCGYEGEHEMPGDWECVHWKAQGGYANLAGDDESAGKANRKRERLWFSPYCLKPTLF